MEISPWADGAVLESPDGTKTARLVDGHEMGQGSPTYGRLVLSTGFQLEACSPSMVWSEDSRFLAVQRWKQLGQSLVIIDTVRGEVHAAPGTFRVLQLSSFRGGIVEGIDSPLHKPTQVRVDTSLMNEWNDSRNRTTQIVTSAGWGRGFKLLWFYSLFMVGGATISAFLAPIYPPEQVSVQQQVEDSILAGAMALPVALFLVVVAIKHWRK
jgi:hypothetical protein